MCPEFPDMGKVLVPVVKERKSLRDRVHTG